MFTSPIAPSTQPSPKERAAAIVKAMEMCLEENDAGGHNQRALQRMQDLVRDLRSIDAPFGEKLGSLLSWSDKFWSYRKHERWGLDALRQSISHDLVSLNMIVSRMN